MNRAEIIGLSGSDAELKYTKNNFPVCNISIATSKKVKEEWKSTWHKVVILGKLAEKYAPMIKKGCKIQVIGEIQNRVYTDSTGNKRYVSEILANEVHVIVRPEKQVTQDDAPSYEPNFGEDDIPF